MSTPLEQIRLGARRLREGGVVAFPTETVYGLGADALSEAAVARVYELKGRPRRNPLIVHVAGPEMARQVVAAGAWTDEAELLARRFWPGPLSIILARSPALPEIVTAGSGGVAVRCPDHPTALALLFEFGGPLVGPSANPSGRVSPTTAAHVREAFDERDVLVLDGGACAGGIESTVLSLMGGRGVPARILRPGLIGAEELARALGRPVVSGPPAAVAEGAPLPGPGLLPRHYAPATPASLFSGRDWPGVLGAVAGPAVVISRTARAVAPPHTLILMPTNAHAYAARLYAALREADALHVAAILIERVPEDGPGRGDGPVWSAIADRLNRATARADNP
jgi:L-threonylcarbamoyladenylate synthase